VPIYTQSSNSSNHAIHPLRQLAPGETETEKYDDQGVLMLLEDCKQDGGGSSCKLATGTFSLNHNDNTCCTRGCTEEHEAQHKKDNDKWGCCKKASVAYNKKGAVKNDIIDKYNAWQRKTKPITECNAYTNDVVCADKLAKKKDCDGKGKDTECCDNIADYKATYEEEAKTNCAAAPKTVEPCPF
jgi:hypothetical protein